MTLLAVPPRPQNKGTKIHLHDPDKQWNRHTSYGVTKSTSMGLCGAMVVWPENREYMKPLSEATDWAGQVQRVDGVPTPILSWCALCLGRAIAQYDDLPQQIVRELADRQQKG